MKSTPKPSHEQHLSFATLTAAAGFLGMPVSALRQAKKAGAAGFRRNGNVDLREVFRWLLTRGKGFAPKVSLEDARATLAITRAKQIEREAALADGTLLSTQEIERTLSLASYLWFQSVPKAISALENDLPASTGPALERALTTALSNTIAAAVNLGADLPDFVVKALRCGGDATYKPETLAEFKARGEALAECIAALAKRDFGAKGGR